LVISGQYNKNIQCGQYLTIGKIIPINFHPTALENREGHSAQILG